jgi:hypothetical protein
LIVLSTRVILRCMEVLAALPHLQKVMDLRHSVQFILLCLSLHFHVVISICRIQYWGMACL